VYCGEPEAATNDCQIAVRCGDPVERGKVSERGGGREWEQNVEREMRCVSA